MLRIVFHSRASVAGPNVSALSRAVEAVRSGVHVQVHVESEAEAKRLSEELQGLGFGVVCGDRCLELHPAVA